jgi:arsenate reductase-like glutaredoxin family protein
MDVQIFGTKNNAETRKALRFFKERRVRVHFVDLKQKAASPRELQRFAQKFGVDALVDRDAKRFKSLGLHAAHYSDARWLELLGDEPAMLSQPLVRLGTRVTVGLAEAEWREWVKGS